MRRPTDRDRATHYRQGADDHELTAALAADQQPGEEIFGPTAGPGIRMERGANVCALMVDIVLSCLHSGPQRICNDAEMRGGRHDPFTLVPDDPLYLPRIRVFFIAGPIPDMLTHIEWIIEQAGSDADITM